MDNFTFYSPDSSKAIAAGTILTIAAAGSEGSPDSVITKEEGMFKRGASGDAIRPKFSILNPALTVPDLLLRCRLYSDMSTGMML